jgi:ceramide glucosyltransferase
VFVYWVLAGLAVLLALASLRGESARRRYVLEGMPAPVPARFPMVTVIVPVKGEDEGLAANLASLAALDYPEFELIVTARSAGDVPAGCVPTTARLVIAGERDAANGEKINNLLAAIEAAGSSTEVLAFADSDGQVRPDWLRALVAALEDPSAGAATGYRWHAPSRSGFWSLLRSEWNAVIAGGFGPGDCRFAWGGAMAIRRADFEAFRVAEYWRGAISDDYRLSEAVRAAGRRIVYAPAALVTAMDHCGGAEFFEWTRRQMMITRFYAPRLWRLALAAHVIYCGAMASSVGLMVGGYWPAAVALALQLGPGMWKSRNRAVLADAPVLAHVILSPLATWAWLWSLIASAFGETITWRGRRYRLTGI